MSRKPQIWTHTAYVMTPNGEQKMVERTYAVTRKPDGHYNVQKVSEQYFMPEAERREYVSTMLSHASKYLSESSQLPPGKYSLQSVLRGHPEKSEDPHQKKEAISS